MTISHQGLVVDLVSDDGGLTFRIAAPERSRKTVEPVPVVPPPPPPPGPGVYLNGTIIDQNGVYIPCLFKLPATGGPLGYSAIDNTFYIV